MFRKILVLRQCRLEDPVFILSLYVMAIKYMRNTFRWIGSNVARCALEQAFEQAIARKNPTPVVIES